MSKSKMRSIRGSKPRSMRRYFGFFMAFKRESLPRRGQTALAGALIGVLATASCTTAEYQVRTENSTVSIRQGEENLVTQYHLSAPSGAGLPVESGGFFHPLMTPEGVRVTDLAPSDHPHHRGIFLAWVEMHGEKDADFWGWGEHAPVKGRRITNQSLETGLRMSDMESRAGLSVVNFWEAEGTVMLEEQLTATTGLRHGVRLLDLHYRLSPRMDLTLSRWAFSGFCVRVRKDGDIRMYSPEGEVTLPNPSHLKPETDWPDAAWYACELTLNNGEQIGVAVIDHPGNPPALWHNHRDVRMLNPCIVAPGEIQLEKNKPLELRYRVVAFDGELPEETLGRLAEAYGAE